jgi:hypothetical protein
MMSNPWYSDSESPEELAAQLDELRQQRAAMTPEQRLELSAFLIEGMEPKPRAKPRETSIPPVPAQTPAPDAPPSSADLHSTLKASADRGQANAPEDKAAWFASKLREAAGTQSAL